MSEAAYEKQHLALHAAGSINGAGTTITAFGCQLTRISTGHYGLVLDASAGLINDESFTRVQVKGIIRLTSVVEDSSNTLKRIHVFSFVGGPPTPLIVRTDAPIEIVLWKSVTRR